jgi:putative transcriptional regulator
MIRVLLKQRLLDKSAKDGQQVSLKEVSEATGIGRATLTRITTKNDYNPSIKVIDKLCDYFECEISDLLVRGPSGD